MNRYTVLTETSHGQKSITVFNKKRLADDFIGIIQNLIDTKSTSADGWMYKNVELLVKDLSND